MSKTKLNTSDFNVEITDFSKKALKNLHGNTIGIALTGQGQTLTERQREALIGELWQRMHKATIIKGMSILKDLQKAEDEFADMMYRYVICNFHKWKNSGSFEAWCKTTIINGYRCRLRFKDHKQHARFITLSESPNEEDESAGDRVQKQILDITDSLIEEPSFDEEKVDEVDELHKALSKLSDTEKKLIQLRFFEKKTVLQCAKEMNISEKEFNKEFLKIKKFLAANLQHIKYDSLSSEDKEKRREKKKAEKTAFYEKQRSIESF